MIDKTVLTSRMHPAALERLRGEAHVVTLETGREEEFLEKLAQVEAVIIGGQRMGPAEMDLAERLLVIGRHGAGMDKVDIGAATARGLPVVYTPYGPTESTAEQALLLMLAVARRLPLFDRAARRADFSLQAHWELAGRELRGKALGVVGFGRIGQRVAAMCRDALDMRIYVHDPYRDPGEVAAWGATYVEDLIELAGTVDVLTVHVPLTPETRHLIDRDVIRAMRADGILVNAARGPVVDEAALVEALQEGHLFGAGLDVFDPEPPEPDNPLLTLDNVVLTPHTGSFTEEGRRLMGMTVVEDTLRVLRGERPKYLANPEVWAVRRGVVDR